MTFRLRIRHTTGYRYAGVVSASYNEARVTPIAADRQLVLEADVHVTPPAPVIRYWDYWGTLVHAFDVHTPHDELWVTGSSVVETAASQPEREPLSWDALATDSTIDTFAELLQPTQSVWPTDEVIETAGRLRQCASPWDAVGAAEEWVAERIRYEKGCTDVRTTVADALAGGGGVCQDFAHVTLALVREMGIPARYASGYMHPTRDAEVGVVVEGESHAWVEAWVGEWRAIDPTHHVPVGERHVLVARGRDYSDVAPLKGIYLGGPSTELEVRVEFERLR